MGIELDSEKDNDVEKQFLIGLLTDFEALKNLIYQGQDVPAYRHVQKISDRIKEKILSL